MKNFIIPALAVAFTSVSAMADITVKLPADSNIKSIICHHAAITKLANAKSRADGRIINDTIPVSNGIAVIPIASDEGGSRYGLEFSSDFIDLFAAPGEKINIDVTSLNPFEYSMTGSAVIDGMNEVNTLSKAMIDKHNKLQSEGQQPSREALDAIDDEYFGQLKDIINKDPGSEAALYSILMLQDEDFIDNFNRLPESSKKSILYPLLESQKISVEKSIAADRRIKELSSGTHPAPNFTLKNLDGKDVSLSDFRGKWVILDFWGSWCGWCIKGIPELKEAYKKYDGKLEIIGIDCRETEEAWRKGVEKYELPWVNVYLGNDGNSLLYDYGVQGFPTKAIIDPKGIIRNITVGHNPEFFTDLSNLLDK